MNSRKLLFVVILTAMISFSAGLYFYKFTSDESRQVSITRFSKNTLTNPLLDCEVYDTNPNTQVNTMKSEVNNLINSYDGRVDEVSVYFRDLNNGPSFGINENDKFSPASLLKVPLMMTYLKKAEKDPSIFSKKIDYSGNHLLAENLPTGVSLTAGENYTVENLLYRMIALSDNLAFEILLNNIDRSEIKSLHKDLDIIYPDNKTPEDYITVKSYAGLFRVLYNATYLNPSMSEKALGYMTQSDFRMGIQAGIPKDIVTALKFGLRDINGEGSQQIHDCGVVYDKKKPYILCIMTRGKNRSNLVELMVKISESVYKNVQDK